MVGRLYLGRSAQFAQVTLQALDGTILAQTSTDRCNFYLPRPSTNDFRLLVRLPDFPDEFAAEVRNWNGRHAVWVNIPTTLASRYLRSHPGLSLEEAETRARRALGIPAPFHLSQGIQESQRNPFSHTAFLRAAGQAGGWGPYSQTVLGQMEGSGGTTYFLTRSDLQSPLTGLEPGLQQFAEDTRRELAARTVFSIDSNRWNPAVAGQAPLPKGQVSATGLATALGSFFYGVAQGAVGNLITAGTNGALGQASSALGWNYGTTAQLNAIYTQVTALESEVAAIAVNSSIQSAAATLNQDSINGIHSATNTIINVTQTATVTNVPTNPAPNVVTLLNTVNGTNWQNSILTIQNYMLGTGGQTNLLQLTATNTVNSLGIDAPATVQGTPWRSNGLLDTMLATYNSYYGYQIQAINLIMESAHSTPLVSPSVDPAGSINDALANVENDAVSLKSQRQQVPVFLPRDDIIVDLEHGLMWYAEMQLPGNWNGAMSMAGSLPVQGQLPDGTMITYDDWRLPTYNEFQSLQNRGCYNPNYDTSVSASDNKDYPSYGRSTQGLPGLGITNVQYAFSLAHGSDGTQDGDLWMLTIQDHNELIYEIGQVFRLNHNDPVDNVSSKNAENDQEAFMLCRTLGPTPVLDPIYEYDNTPTVITDPVPSPFPSPVAGRALVPGEYAAYGIVTGIAAPTTVPGPAAIFVVPSPGASPSPEPLPANAVQAVTNVTFTLNLGGSVTVGTGANTLSYTVDSLTSSANVSSANSGSLPNYLNRMLQFVCFTPSWGSLLANIPGTDGILIPHQAGSATVAVSYAPVASATPISAQGSVTASSASPHNLLSLQIAPRNQLYSGQAATNNYFYYCTGFYSDGTLSSQAANVAWNVTVPSTAPTGFTARITPVGNGVQLQLNTPPSNAPAFNVTVAATLGNVTDSTVFQVLPLATSTGRL